MEPIEEIVDSAGDASRELVAILVEVDADLADEVSLVRREHLAGFEAVLEEESNVFEQVLLAVSA